MGQGANRRGRPEVAGAAVLHADDVPLSVGGSAARGTRPQLHPRRRPLPLPPDAGRPHPQPDGLGLLRPAGRERRHPARRPSARLDAQQHPSDEGAVRAAGASSTTGRKRSPPASRTTTAGTSGCSCACSRTAWPTRRSRRSTGAPAASTVLANEQVVDGACERCGSPVRQRDLEQWFLRITDYAEELLADLDGLQWPERVKVMQRNWIGRSEGADLDFALPGIDETLTVFTTRPDTIHGATFMVLAPEHPLRGATDRRASAAGGDRGVDREGAQHAADRARGGGAGQGGLGHRPGGDQPGDRRARCRSGWPTTCSSSTAPAPSWRCPRTTAATSSSLASTACRCGWSITRRSARWTRRRWPSRCSAKG